MTSDSGPHTASPARHSTSRAVAARSFRWSGCTACRNGTVCSIAAMADASEASAGFPTSSRFIRARRRMAATSPCSVATLDPTACAESCRASMSRPFSCRSSVLCFCRTCTA